MTIKMNTFSNRNESNTRLLLTLSPVSLFSSIPVHVTKTGLPNLAFVVHRAVTLVQLHVQSIY